MPADAAGRAGLERLWRRLLSGELTEVYGITGPGFTGSPMGLEPISVCAYEYDLADGEPNSEEERGEIARRLSVRPYWYVCSEHVAARLPRSVTAWDRYFIARAQVALIVLKTTRVRLFFRRVRTLLRGRKAARSDFAAGAASDPAVAKFSRNLTRPRSPRPVPYSLIVARYLLDKYPEKTLIVSNPQDVRQLADLRIQRAGRRSVDGR